MPSPAINLNDIPKDAARKLGLAKQRDRGFSKDYGTKPVVVTILVSGPADQENHRATQRPRAPFAG